MLATRESEVGLVDLLDRVLHKGLVLNADVIITVSGIPLIGLNLRAILASVDTMVAYGMWKDWDQAQRAIASEEERHKVQEATRFLQGQTPVYRSFCSCRKNSGTIRAWRPGTLYVTDTRVVVNRREPLEILSESEFEKLAGYAIEDAETAGAGTKSAPVWQGKTSLSTTTPNDAGVSAAERGTESGASCKGTNVVGLAVVGSKASTSTEALAIDNDTPAIASMRDTVSRCSARNNA